MFRKTAVLAALAATTAMAAAPAFADGHRDFRDRRVFISQPRAPQHAERFRVAYRAPAYRPVVVQRPVYVQPAPAVVYRAHGSSDVLGGLIVGAVLGAVIASHAGY
jgi:hypothetical protein